MARRIGCECYIVDLERYSDKGYGFIGGEFRTDQPWHNFNFTNDPNGDGKVGLAMDFWVLVLLIVEYFGLKLIGV